MTTNDEATRQQPTPGGTGADITTRAINSISTREAFKAIDTDLDLSQILRDVRNALFTIKGRRLGTDDLDVISDAIAEDLEARAKMGERKYGTRLRAHNGRDAELDLLQELYDVLMYGVQLLEERPR